MTTVRQARKLNEPPDTLVDREAGGAEYSQSGRVELREGGGADENVQGASGGRKPPREGGFGGGRR